MVVIKNERLAIEIDEKGAELVSVRDLASDYEFIWQGQKRSWNRHAPVLFPIVGSLKDGKYEYQGKTYEMGQHGFARDMVFETQTVTKNSATFYIKSNPDTLAVYPFEFSFQITYILVENKLSISYEVLNPSQTETLYYSVGGHPGFNVSHYEPQKGQPEYVNVSYHFEPSAPYYCYPIVEGRVRPDKAKYQKIDHNPILHKTFKRDALIYRVPKGTEVSLLDPENGVKIKMTMTNLDYIGIWSSYPKKAGFVCLEPWAGLTDPFDASGRLEEKLAINHLQAGQLMTHDYTVTFDKQAY